MYKTWEKEQQSKDQPSGYGKKHKMYQQRFWENRELSSSPLEKWFLGSLSFGFPKSTGLLKNRALMTFLQERDSS